MDREGTVVLSLFLCCFLPIGIGVGVGACVFVCHPFVFFPQMQSRPLCVQPFFCCCSGLAFTQCICGGFILEGWSRSVYVVVLD